MSIKGAIVLPILFLLLILVIRIGISIGYVDVGFDSNWHHLLARVATYAVIGLFLGYITARMRKLPDDFTSRLYALVSDYDPIDLDAYRALQEQIRDENEDDIEAIAHWLKHEQHALDNQNRSQSSERDRLLDRNLE